MTRFIAIWGFLVVTSLYFTHGQAQAMLPKEAAILPPVFSLLLEGQSNDDSIVNAAITPSRTDCASPCTVVLSAEKTTAEGLDEHGIWSQLSYYWDFDTDESDTYGSLYKQTYTYVEGDTSFEKGHVPMVTKTFLCETGTCTYNVGMRAQNEEGDFNDAFVTITVKSESLEWSAANTICVSNTLDTATDWTGFDKECPAGATKQDRMPNGDQYNGKLVLMKRGDVFSGRGLATYPDQSNFKIGVFGNKADGRPELDAPIALGVTNFVEGFIKPNFANYLGINDAQVQQYGWPSNIYIEGLKVQEVAFPMSYEHVGLHDIDMDREDYTIGGNISIAAGVGWCYGTGTLDHNGQIREGVDCSLVPFPKGGYISSVDIVGNNFEDHGPGLNIGQTTCAMVNFLGMTDTRVRLAFEHNIRIAGWYRLNFMRSLIRGQHNQPTATPKNGKITLRSCNRSGGGWERGVWASAPDLPSTWKDDIMNPDGSMRARKDSDSTDSLSIEHLHQSRYQVIAYNQIGDRDAPLGKPGVPGSGAYSTSIPNDVPVDHQLQSDLMIAHNIFEAESVIDIDNVVPWYSDITLVSSYGTCVANQYAPTSGIWCTPKLEWILPGAMPNFRREPVPIAPPLAPTN